METTTKKITMATVKSFVKKNGIANIYVKVRGSFDGMTDGIEYNSNPEFVPAQPETRNNENNLGIKQAWFVGQSRDFFKPFSNDDFTGIEVSNSCGYFTIAIKKI